MSDATVRRGMPDPQLSREAFRERFLGPFRDPAGATGTESAEGSEAGGSTIPLDAGSSSEAVDADEQSVLPVVAGVGVAAMALGGVVVALRRRTTA